MTLADDLKSLVYTIRAIPGELGMHPHSVTLVESDWAGTHSGDGSRTDTSTALLESGQNPHVKWLSDEELAVAGLSAGEIEVGPLTPDHGAVSRLASLRGDSLSDTDARYLLITGPKHPNGARYRITDLKADRPFRYMLRAAPVESVTP